MMGTRPIRAVLLNPVLPELLLPYRHEMIGNGASGMRGKRKDRQKGSVGAPICPVNQRDGHRAGMDISSGKKYWCAKPIASARSCIIFTKHLGILRKGPAAPTLGMLR
jgi:hypothetical protein